MARDIKSLLNKKGWTGLEVGQALIASLIHEMKHLGKEVTPLFSQADLDRMESGIKSRDQYVAYGVFRSIYSAVVDGFNKGQGLYQQFYNGYYRHFMILQQIMSSEQALKELEAHPLIMTQEQYDRLKAEITEENRSTPLSFRDILFDLLSYYMRKDQEDPASIPEAIRAALETSKAEPVTNKRILENYNEDMAAGYYTLPDGSRSDQMTSEEWQEALKKDYMKRHQLTINGEPASYEETLKTFNQERWNWGRRLLYGGMDSIRGALEEKGLSLPEGTNEALLMEEIENLLIMGGDKEHHGEKSPIQALIEGESSYSTTWHYYDDPPEDLTKYDILDQLSERYCGAYTDRLLNGELVEELSEAEQLKEFITDYPALFSALKGEIERLIPSTKKLKANQRCKEITTWGELADLEIPYYQAYIEPDIYSIANRYQENTGGGYAQHKRISSKGIAIIQKPHKWDLDEQGDYQEERNPLHLFLNIGTIAENQESRIDIQAARETLMIPALRYLYAYNVLIEIIGRAYDIEGIEHLKQKLSTFEHQLEATNDYIYLLYYTVYGTPEEKAQKREYIKELFKPIEVEDLKPTQEAIASVEKAINGLGLGPDAVRKLRTFDAFIGDLMRGEA